MSFFAVLLALVIEQIRPLARDNPVHASLRDWVAFTGRNFDAGKPHHTWVVWFVSVGVPTVVAAVLYRSVVHYSDVLALVFDVAVLYVTLGFRQFSHYVTDIRDALERGDEAQARTLLAEWCHLDTRELPRSEVLRHVIEHALLAAHRHVFGVFFWFVLLSALGLGPAGAVLYRMAEFVARYWAYRSRTLDMPSNPPAMALGQRMFSLVDFMPARMTAFGFAVVGNFEEAINHWRRHASLWKHENEGIILASAAGAVGLQLGGSAPPGITPDRSKPFAGGGVPDDAQAQGSTGGLPPTLAHLPSVVALVWRSVVLWLLLVALLTFANLLG